MSEELDPLGPPAPSPATPVGTRSPHKGWRSRGYLPHCDGQSLTQHIVFGLADALPVNAAPPSAIHAEQVLDRGLGDCVLRDARCAEIIEAALTQLDGEQYRLIAWCVMPNHVHVIAEQVEGYALDDVVQAWKSVSAHRINRLLSRKGRLWRREYYDRFMRDDDHLENTIAYVEDNPVTARLVFQAFEWPWSSARRRAGEGAGGPR